MTAACTVCSCPVACGQGAAHYSCSGMCGTCWSRPSQVPGAGQCDRCATALDDDLDEDELYRGESR